jgi:lipopolysaccharide/colanic/teichoic acid biosynthesis glycosyltransferase
MTILYIGNSIKNFGHSCKNKSVSQISVSNSIDGTQLLKSNTQIDVIICDSNLPDNSGLFLYDAIQADVTIRNRPFIIISKTYNNQLFKGAFKKGINDYFVTTSTTTNQIIERAESLYTLTDNLTNISEKFIKTEMYKLPVSKRVFDVVFASFALLLLSPLMLLIMLAIRIESKGKVYYIAKRVGRKTFDFYKLRSMRSGSDTLIKKLAKENNQYNKEKIVASINFDQPCPKCDKILKSNSCTPLLHIDNNSICDYWYNHQKEEVEKNNSTFIKIANDPRITSIGKFIRNTSIDELPQLINVIKGDMSIVGNRPLPIYEAELLTNDNMSKRFLAPAGITGLWQVELRGKGGDMSEIERMRLDNQYAEKFTGNNYSFWYDIKLILRTFHSLLQKSTV